MGVWHDVDGSRCGSALVLLSIEGSREAAGWSVQSREATIDAREALLLLIGTVGFEQTAPALAMRGHPRLTKAGNNFANLSRKCL